MPSPRRTTSAKATRINHDGPNLSGSDGGYGSMYPAAKLTSDVALALGSAPRARDKVYLTASQFASYGIVERPRADPRVTVEEVLETISAIGLEPHHCNGAGQPVYDPVPIRWALTAVPVSTVRESLRSGRGLCARVAHVLRAMVETGLIDRLPPSSLLASEFGVSERTIRSALEVIRKEGIVYSIPGQGTFVVPGPEDDK